MQRRAVMRCPAAVPAIAIACGTAVAAATGWPPAPYAIALLVASWSVTLVCVLCGRSTLLLCAFSGGFFAAGLLLGADAWRDIRDPPLRQVVDRFLLDRLRDEPAIVEGTLRADAASAAYGASLDIAVDRLQVRGKWIDVRGGARIAVGGTMVESRRQTWRGGRRVRLPVFLRRAAAFRNPGVPDQEDVLARRGTVILGSVKSGALVEVLARGSLISEAAGAIRARVRRIVAQAVRPHSARSAEIVTAILIGDRSGLGEEVEERLQEAGTYHVIAISGGNIAILAAILVGAGRLIGVGFRSTAAVAVLCLSCYACIVGQGASVFRATLMAVIYLAARIVDHRSPPLNALALAAALLVAVSPLSLFDIGFWLTFAATIAILVGTPQFLSVIGSQRSGRARELFQKGAIAIIALLGATICAEAATLPISAYGFSRVTGAGLLLNFVAIPLMSVVQVTGLAVIAIGVLHTGAARVMGLAAHAAAWGLVESARFVDLVPWLVARVPPPPLIVVFVYYASLAGAIVAAYKRLWRVLALATSAVVGIWILEAPVLTRSAPLLRVTFLDVDQADAVLIRFPDGRSMLVDTGGSAAGSFDVGSRIVAPALWALSVRRLEVLALTHGDPDHIGGALAVVRDFRPRELWEGVPVLSHQGLRDIEARAAAAGATWRSVKAGEERRFGLVTVRVLSPEPPEWERQKVRNDDSIVLDLRYGAVSILLTGDIGRDVEARIISQLTPAPLRIVKVPHHGSRSSSSPEFIDSSRPAAAIVSAGRANRFGHPAPDVVARYQSVSARVFRTDTDGAIDVDTDGKRVTIRSATGAATTMMASP